MGANVNTKDVNGWTPLMFLADGGKKLKFGFPETIKLLLLHGADINAKNNEGKTAIDIARDKKHKKAVKLLKKHGAK